ncbi:MAG: translation initiation factor IF-2, partial [Bacteroidales bacterium]|nr:translation initiation factor IF-2 [Bacteroidales bacterium]
MNKSTGVKRLAKVAKEINVGVQTVLEFLNKNGFPIDNNPNAKIDEDAYNALLEEFHLDKTEKQESMKISLSSKKEKLSAEIAEAEVENFEEKENSDAHTPVEEKPAVEEKNIEKPSIKVVSKIDLDSIQNKGKKKTTEKKEEPEVVKEEEKPKKEEKTEIPVAEEVPEILEKTEITGPKVVGVIDLEVFEKKKPKEKEKEKKVSKKKTTKTDKKKEELVSETIKEEKLIKNTTTKEKSQSEKTDVPEKIEDEDRYVKTKYQKLSGPKVVGSIDLKEIEKKPAKEEDKPKKERKHRPRIHKQKKENVVSTQESKPVEKTRKGQKGKKHDSRPVISEEDIEKHIKETLSQLQNAPKSKSSKYRRMKREAAQQQRLEEMEEMEKEQNILKVNEFITVSELATLMNVPATKVIGSCMSMGLFVSLNQRLDAEAITIVAAEFGYDVNFISIEDELTDLEEEIDNPEDLVPRAPVVTVMGHVDHGKTSLLDNIRNSNVIAGESGGITQHIGAYEVTLESGRKITFLDTPGHEAFTAMRARGAKITDVAIIVIAADDQVMPQTVEAINHARAATVPMIFAITKIDKQGANPEKIKEQLANMNLLVEDWGGKYQCQEIDAKHGVNVDILLEKVLLEADMLELKANPKRTAIGSVIESSLDKGRGYTATVLVQTGSMYVGDMALAGSYFGRIKAMFNERNQPVTVAGPSTPVLILGLNGAPAAGDKLTIHKEEKTAKDIALKRQQLIREQALRTQKHITLDEIGRRIAIGDFKELNIIVKGDVDGSVEALADSLLKLAIGSVQVNVIHKAIGGITESDVLLATASNAIIIGFQVRPSVAARKLAETEQIEIRTYSVIYDAIEEVKDAIEGMLEPKIEEKVVASVEVKEVFKISKVGAIA